MNYFLPSICDAVGPLLNPRSFLRLGMCLALVILSVLIVINTASAEWSSSATENLPLCTAQNEQHFPAIVTDGQGGAIVAWSDARHANRDIFAQRISATGEVHWQANGIPICDLPSSQSWPLIARRWRRAVLSSSGGIPGTVIRIVTHSASTQVETNCGTPKVYRSVRIQHCKTI